MNWYSDDKNSSVFIRVQVPVPRAATVSNAQLVLESNAQQLQGAAGSTLVNVNVEQVDNAQSLSGDMIRRNSFGAPLPSRCRATGRWPMRCRWT